MMVGALVDCASGKGSMANIGERLVRPSRKNSARVVAPSAGLILVRIRY
jgi:hypothetical protein